uniref:Glutathione peroxidase 4 n=1 Tax=Aquila chrysaetos chrysaetos TaxID=223781 RepID=A0A663DZY6_AQUCH
MGWGRAVRRALQCGAAVVAARGPARSMVSAATAGPAPHRTGCAQAEDWRSAKAIYDFHARDIDGNDVSLEKYRGYVCIITNVASK